MNEPSRHEFHSGDKVTYISKRMTGRSINLRACKGTVVSDHGAYIRIKACNGRSLLVQADMVTLDGEQNALTRALTNNLKVVSE